jgi:putative hemolysin
VFALRNKEWVCLYLSPPMQWFVFTVWPVVWTLETIVTTLMNFGERHFRRQGDASRSEASELHELRASATLARASRLIGAHEERIILAAAALSQRPLREAMLPASFIRMLSIDASIADALMAAHLDMHTRFPVTERPGDPQGIVGYVNFKDLVAALRLAPQSPKVGGISRAIPSLSAGQSVALCLEQLIRERTHIALVRDEAGTVVGMVTLEDLIEELVGDIEDEFDNLPVLVVRSGGGWVVGGGVSPEKLRTSTGLQLPAFPETEPVRHLSDWVLRKLGRPVQGGEVIESDGLRVVVRKVRRQMVQEAQIQEQTARAEEGK